MFSGYRKNEFLGYIVPTVFGFLVKKMKARKTSAWHFFKWELFNRETINARIEKFDCQACPFFFPSLFFISFINFGCKKRFWEI